MKRLILIFSCFALVVTILVSNAEVASASGLPGKQSTTSITPLSGESYNGQWPDQSGCWNSSAYIVLSKTYTYVGVNTIPMKIVLWYSPTCQTNWADFQLTDYQSREISADATRKSDQLRKSSAKIRNWRVWSPMVYAPNTPTRACGNVYISEILGGGVTLCVEQPGFYN